MNWFKHDSNANSDPKLKKLRMKYGLEGYGLYWYCVELIAGNVSASNVAFELEHDSEILAFDLGIHVDRVSEMMAYMVDLKLFDNEGGVIVCIALAKRADEYTAKALKKKLSEIKAVANCPESVRRVSGDRPETVRSVSEDCPETVRNMTGECPESVQKVSGGCLESARIISGECTLQSKVDKNKKHENKIKQKKSFVWDEIFSIELQKEILNLRKNANATLTQRALNQITGEIRKAMGMGYTMDQVMDVWSLQAWRSFKCEYIMGKVTPAVRTVSTPKNEPEPVQYSEDSKREINDMLNGMKA